MPITTKQDINSTVFKEFGGNLAYSWSRQNAVAGRRDARVYTTETGTLEHLRGLLEPLDESFNDDKCDAGYLCPAMEETTNPDRPETTARRGMYYRCDASVLSSSIVTLDIDDATPADFEADSRLVRRARDAMTLYTTASHTPAAPRYRIVAVVDTPLMGENIVKARYGLVAMLFEGRKLDRASFTLSQAMYRPYTGSDVIHSKGVRMFDAAELVEFCPEGVRIAQGARETRLSDAERAKMGAYAEWMEKACFELDGAFKGPNLILTPTPDHAYDSGYSSDPKLGDFQFCPPREGFNAPNITVLHDSDKAAFEGMTGRQKMEYFIAAVGMDADMSSELFSLLGWTTAANDSVCTDADLSDVEGVETDSQSKPVIENMLETRRVGMLYGGSGAGKTTLTGYLAYCMMAGKAVFGSPKLRTVKRRVGYMSFEGSCDDVKRALRANDIRYGAGVQDQLQTFEGLNFDDKEAVLQFVAKNTGKLDVLFVDTLSAAAGDRDQNSNMQGLMNTLASLARVMNIAVVPIHHTGRNGDHARGTTQIEGAVDYNYYFDTVDAQKKDRANFEVKKMRGIGMKSGFAYGIKSSTIEVMAPEEFAAYEAEQDDVFAGCDLGQQENPGFEVQCSSPRYAYSYDDYIGEAWTDGADGSFSDTPDAEGATFLGLLATGQTITFADACSIFGVSKNDAMKKRARPFVDAGLAREVSLPGNAKGFEFDGRVEAIRMTDAGRAILSAICEGNGAPVPEITIAERSRIKAATRSAILRAFVKQRVIKVVEGGYVESLDYDLNDDLA